MPDRHADVAKRVWFRMLRLESRLGSAVAERLREINLSVPQCDVLTTLTEEEGVSQQKLAKRLYVTKGNISGLLDRLESAGLVERRSTASDRRQYEIYLTPSGREAAVKAIAMQEAVISGDFRPNARRRFENPGADADDAARHRARRGDGRAGLRRRCAARTIAAAASIARPWRRDPRRRAPGWGCR